MRLLNHQGKQWVSEFPKRVKTHAYGIGIAVGLVALTAVMVRVAYLSRGYFAFGGEWLVSPIAAIVWANLKQIKSDISEDVAEIRKDRAA